MPRTEEGEYELVLGNRQLLSIIFIIMILFGVVFSLGYFMGRSAGPEPGLANAAARPLASEPAGQPGAASPSPAPLAPAAEAPLEPGQARIATGAPESAGPAQSETAAPPTPGATPAESKPAPVAPPAETPAAAAAEAPPYPEPAPGQAFLQVAAVKRPEAELIVDVLKKKGFGAVVAPGPSETLFRVLVGPLKDSDAVGKTRADLEAAGFKSSYLRKY